MMTFITVNTPVCALQFDASSSATPAINPGVTGKRLDTRQVSAGVWRCVLWEMNKSTVSGKIVNFPGPVTSISNVFASDGIGNNVSATIGRISSPTGLKSTLKLR